MPPAVHRIALGELPPGGLRVRLGDVPWTDASFQLLAFLNLPDARLDAAGIDDPRFAGAFFMYGAGERSDPERRISLAGAIPVEPALIARAGRPAQNELVLVPFDLAGRRLQEMPVAISGVDLEPLP